MFNWNLRWAWASPLVLVLAACGLPPRAPAPQLYDLGPVEDLAPAAEASRPPLALQVQATTALDGSAMLYRLAYADANQLRAYSLARWAMPPAELLQQRLRARLAGRYTLLPGTGGARVLLLELEEFSQNYTAPAESQGLLRLRASLVQRTAAGDQLLAQRELRLTRPAPTHDAPGGVRALGAAVDAAAQELAQWLQQPR